MKDNKELINEATYWKNKQKDSIIKKYENITKDPDKKIRLEKNLCEMCYYKDVIAGQAFTKRNCSFCEKEENYPTTYTDKLCLKCAKDNKCCKHCMAKI